MTYLSPRRMKHLRNWMIAALVVLVPFMAWLNFRFFTGLEEFSVSAGLVLLLLGDFVLGLAVVVFLALQMVRKAVRRKDLGIESPIQLRLSQLFAIVSLVSAVAVAVVATLTVNQGLGGFLRVFVSESVNSSRIAAQSYFDEEVAKVGTAVTGLARIVASTYDENGQPLRQILQSAQDGLEEKVDYAFLISGNCHVLARGNGSYLFDYTPPPASLVDRLAILVDQELPAGDAPESNCSYQEGVAGGWNGYVEPLEFGDGLQGFVYRQRDGNSFSALHRIAGTADLYLLVTNYSIRSILNVHDVLRPGAPEGPIYTVRRLGEALVLSSVAYLLITLVIVFAMIGLGIAFARRISKPIENLAATASAIEGGMTDVKVAETGDDEVAMLSRSFNQMLGRIRGHTAKLIELREVAEENRDLAEKREQSFRSVLSSVSAGVIGLDPDTRIVFMNESAGSLLGVRHEEFNELSESFRPHKLASTVPEFVELLEELRSKGLSSLQWELDLTTGNEVQNRLLVQLAERRGRRGLEGYVIAFDDITELLETKERAAWSFAARQIAHEIRNPLYPMLLAVQDMQDLVKEGAVDEARKESFTGYLQMIEKNITNTEKLTDTFSEFAKLPEPELVEGDICATIEQAVATEVTRGLGVAVMTEFDARPIIAEFDPSLLLSAMVNLLKNAGEALSEFRNAGQVHEGWTPQIRASAGKQGSKVEIRVMDNGPGFAAENRDKFLRPFFSTKREVSRGIGLAYVDRVVSGHGGSLELGEAPAFDQKQGNGGALVTIWLPIDGGTLKDNRGAQERNGQQFGNENE